MTKEQYKELCEAIDKQAKLISNLVEAATMDMNATSAAISLDMLSFNGGMLIKKSISIQMIAGDGIDNIDLRRLVKEHGEEAIKGKPEDIVKETIKELQIDFGKPKEE